MTERLHYLAAALCLVFALGVGCTHQAAGSGDPSYKPDNAVRYQP